MITTVDKINGIYQDTKLHHNMSLQQKYVSFDITNIIHAVHNYYKLLNATKLQSSSCRVKMGASESRPSSRKAKYGKNKKQKRQGEAQNIEKSYTTLMQYVHDNVIGDGVIFDGPYGKRSGR